MEQKATDSQVCDRICDRFERDWLQTKQLSVEQFVATLSESITKQTLDELIVVEMDLLHTQGMRLDAEDYLRRFPDCKATIEQSMLRLNTLDRTSLATMNPMETNELGERSCLNLPPIVGKFRILRKIGEGSFGVVFKAQCLVTGATYALKFPKRSALQNIEELRNLVAEVELAKQLNHEAIVRTYGLGESDGFVFAIQEFVDGVTLAELCPSDPIQIVQIVTRIAEGLAHAHQDRMVHRDVKPANILMADSDHPKIADFGLSIHESAQRRLRGQRCGTPNYMSPEQAMGLAHQLDGRSDVWSLGVLLYELLTGELPFRGDSAEDICEEVRLRNEKPIRMLRPELDVELQRICSKCLTKSIRDRYPTAIDLVEDLRSWLSLETKWEAGPEPPLVPRGLRAYRYEDSDAYLRLLVGRRNRQGVPESIQFWKGLVESKLRSQSFGVGALLGPSGCGKSSFIRAGLIPRLNPNLIRSFYVEAGSSDTEQRIKAALLGSIPLEASDLSLVQIADGIRSRLWPQKTEAYKHLLILDQFEQWLLANPQPEKTELFSALRHCDGEAFSCIVLVRDEFWLAASHLFQLMNVEWNEDRNIQRMDLLNEDQAQLALHQLGHALDRLPHVDHPLSNVQQQFLIDAIDAISDNGRITCVHLAVLAEMFKSQEWTPRALRSLGGFSGVGEAYLETILGAQAGPRPFAGELANRVLEQLLPTLVTSKVRDRSRTAQELFDTTDAKDPLQLTMTLEWLDRDLRLVTRTGTALGSEINTSPRMDGSVAQIELTDGSELPLGSYQLSHDYLVPSLRNWLSRNKRYTWRGRAELKLEELSGQWQAKNERRFLPSPWDHAKIRLAVPLWRRTKSQVDFLKAAYRQDAMKMGILMLLFIFAFGMLRNNRLTIIHSDLRQRLQRVMEGEPGSFAEERAELEKNLPTVLSIIHKDQAYFDRFPIRKSLVLVLNASLVGSNAQFEETISHFLENTELLEDAEMRLALELFERRAPAAIALLQKKFAGSQSNRERARLAALLLYLNRPDSAEAILKVREDPTAGTELSHRILKLFPRKEQLWALVESHKAKPNLLFGLLVAASRSSNEDWTPNEKRHWRMFLQEEYLENPDSGVHSLCLYIANQMHWLEPDVNQDAWQHAQGSPTPRKGFQWWQVNVAPGIDMTFVLVPSGSAIRNPPDLPLSLKPVFRQGERVTLDDGFWIAQHETPFALFKYWLESETPMAEDDDTAINNDHRTVEERLRRSRVTQGLFDVNDAPLAGVTMREVLAMTKFLNQTKRQIPNAPDRQVYGIPFLVEHDFALRAGSHTDFHFGDSSVGSYLSEYAVTTVSEADALDYSKLSENKLSRLPNRLGLFNIIGNLSEYAIMTNLEQDQDPYPNCWLVGGQLGGTETCKSWYVKRTSENTVLDSYSGVRFGLFSNR